MFELIQLMLIPLCILSFAFVALYLKSRVEVEVKGPSISVKLNK